MSDGGWRIKGEIRESVLQPVTDHRSYDGGRTYETIHYPQPSRPFLAPAIAQHVPRFEDMINAGVQRALALAAARFEDKARSLLRQWGEAAWTARDILPPLEVQPGPGPIGPRLRLVRPD